MGHNGYRQFVRWIMLLQKLRPDAGSDYICTFFLHLAVGLKEAFCGNELSSMAFNLLLSLCVAKETFRIGRFGRSCLG